MTASLRTVSQMASSLLNSAGWKNYVLGAMTATSITLVCTDGAFLVTDIGKTICVDGAGTGGTILETTIAGWTSATQVTLAAPAVVTVAGATVSYGGRLTDDRRNLLELNEGAFESDEDFYVAIAETLGHWARQDLMALSGSIANAGEIPHIGELGEVLIQVGAAEPYLPGKPAEYEEITRLRANTGVAPLNVYGSLAHDAVGSQIGGYFRASEDGDYLYYTGSDAKVKRIPSYTRGTDLQSPAIFTGPIASRLVARLMAKEGSRSPEMAQIHAAYSQACIDAIRARAKTMPILESFEEKPQRKVA